MTHDTSQTTLVLGGGPAGLTAGYLLGQANRSARRLRGRGPGRRDRQDGRARRLPLRPRRASLLHEVDRGGHALARGARRRVPAAPADVADLLEQPLPRLPAARPRRDPQARAGRADALPGVLLPALRCAATRSTSSLEDWVSNRFGRRLFELFFKSYTEKVWGVPTTEIRAEWAAQRIKGLSFVSAAQGRVLRQQGRQGQEPDLGVQLPALRPRPDVGGDARRDRGAGRRGAARRPRRAAWSSTGGRVARVVVGGETFESPDAVISSLPLREVVEMIAPPRRRRWSTRRAGCATATS